MAPLPFLASDSTGPMTMLRELTPPMDMSSVMAGKKTPQEPNGGGTMMTCGLFKVALIGTLTTGGTTTITTGPMITPTAMKPGNTTSFINTHILTIHTKFTRPTHSLSSMNWFTDGNTQVGNGSNTRPPVMVPPMRPKDSTNGTWLMAHTFMRTIGNIQADGPMTISHSIMPQLIGYKFMNIVTAEEATTSLIPQTLRATLNTATPITFAPRVSLSKNLIY
jgi:hypothetical protein